MTDPPGNTSWEGVKKTESDSSQWCPVEGREQWAQTQIHVISFELKRKLFYGGQTLEQVAHRGHYPWRYLKPDCTQTSPTCSG